MVDITIPIAFVAGVLSFLSPCILPLVPAYLSYLAGTSVTPGEQKPSKSKIFVNALLFVLGFSLVFSLLGVLLATVLSNVALDVRTYLTIGGGAVIITFGGLLIVSQLGMKIPFLSSEHRIKPGRFKSNYLSSFVFGVAFAAGWTPCIGAVLGGILTLAIVQPASAFNLMIAFSLGIGVPFLVAGAFISQFSRFIARFARFMKAFTIAMGAVLIVVGILVAIGFIGSLSSFLPAELAAFESMVLG